MNEFERTKEMSLIKFINYYFLFIKRCLAVDINVVSRCARCVKRGGGKGCTRRPEEVHGGRADIWRKRIDRERTVEQCGSSLIRINSYTKDSRDEIRRKLNSSEEKKN